MREYPHAVMGWATAEAICAQLRAWLDGQSLDDALTETTTAEETERRTGDVVRRSMRTRRTMSVLDQLHRHETRAMHLRQRLGLDPLGRARLGKDVAAAKFDLARYWAEEADEEERQAAASDAEGEAG